MNMSENINIVARRIFNKLSEDISDLRGLSQEWSSISPNVMKLEIRRSWEQIFTDEIEKHTAELQSKVSDLEEANRSNLIVMSALQNAHEMEKARVKRLEEAGDRLDSHIACGCGVDGPCRSCVKSLEGWKQAKETKP